MDESCVFLVNLHQLLVSFVPHAGLWVRSHCNEVGYTLHEGNHEDVMYSSSRLLLIKRHDYFLASSKQITQITKKDKLGI